MTKIFIWIVFAVLIVGGFASWDLMTEGQAFNLFLPTTTAPTLPDKTGGCVATSARKSEHPAGELSSPDSQSSLS
jgi:hypothetical protein